MQDFFRVDVRKTQTLGSAARSEAELVALDVTQDDIAVSSGDFTWKLLLPGDTCAEGLKPRDLGVKLVERIDSAAKV